MSTGKNTTTKLCRYEKQIVIEEVDGRVRIYEKVLNPPLPNSGVEIMDKRKDEHGRDND